jgi:hypothetical protein
MKPSDNQLTHRVSTYRQAGLEARWGRTRNGAPAIFVRNPQSKLRHQRESWWMVTGSMFNAMKRDGVLEGFENCTLIADVFSIPA